METHMMEQPIPVPAESSFEGLVIEKTLLLEVDEQESTCRTEMSDGSIETSDILEEICTENFLEVHHETKQQGGLPEKTISPGRGSMKRTPSERLHVSEERGSWKCLPAPNMALIAKTMSAPIEGPITGRKDASVRFGLLQVRSYNQTIGDNPSVSYGPPIQLDWAYEEHEPIGIDEWEDNRAQRRTMRQMVLSYYQRRNLLSWQYGVSDEEIKAVKKEVKKIKFERHITNTFIILLKVEALVESVGRKAKRLLKRRKQKSS